MTRPLTEEAGLRPPQHIKVQGRRIHLRLAQNLAWGVIAANIVILAAYAVYYGITQQRYGPVWLKPGWDGLFRQPWWPLARHDIRDVFEGVGARIVTDTIMTRWQKCKIERAGPLRMATAPLVIFLVALPLVIAGIWVLNFGAPDIWHLLFRHYVIRQTARPTPWLSDYLSTFNWQPFILGFIIGRIVRKIWLPVGSTIQLYFVEKQVDKFRDDIRDGKSPEAADRHRPRWPLPPVIRERYAWITDNSIKVPDVYGGWARWVIPVMTVAFFALACWGGYIKYVIAKG